MTRTISRTLNDLMLTQTSIMLHACARLHHMFISVRQNYVPHDTYSAPCPALSLILSLLLLLNTWTCTICFPSSLAPCCISGCSFRLPFTDVASLFACGHNIAHSSCHEISGVHHSFFLLYYLHCLFVVDRFHIYKSKNT